ncbi:ATP-binding protein [Acaryochloris marina NIES-2412]|uniref:ATP-binding protein n=1 Tax=Acaryochloris marina TaxID=155978 RepID=UPI00405934A4
MSMETDPNRHYLAAACHDLRLRLRQLAGDETVTSAMIVESEVAISAAAVLEPLPAAVLISQRFNLSKLEMGILLLCVAMEVDPQVPDLCDQAQGGRGWAFPTFALAFQLFEEVRWEVCTIDAPLRYWQLIQLHAPQPQPQPLPQTMLKVDERIVNSMMGSGQVDHRLTSLVLPLMSFKSDVGGAAIAPSQQVLVTELCQDLAKTDPNSPLPIVQLLGTDAQSKHSIAYQVAIQFGAQLYGLMGELIPTANQDFSDFLRLWEREAYLSPVALYLDTQEVVTATSSRVALRRFLSHCRGLLFVDSREVRLPPNRQALTREVAKPTPLEQRKAWTQALGKVAGEHPALLTSQFNLNLDEIEEIAGTILPQAFEAEGIEKVDTPTHPPDLKAKLWFACLNRTRPRLESLAQRLETKATWEQLVLPEEGMGVLRQMVDQVRLRAQVYDDWGFRERMNRGLGVSAVFAGESGTGKTMAAEVIANELNLHLYRIDLSSVVSKYIGETEKNLRRLFDAAEEGGAILFFDEADALFSKRSEVKDSHDRYANIETDYLLQRVESYRGLAILATNLKSSLDGAFLRRLRFLINFPFPSQEYRQQLWRKVFPDRIPTELLDYEYLGQFNITGGTIHTVALNAAFMAARQREAVGMSQILASIRTEYQKLDRQIYEAEFQWEEQQRTAKVWELSPQEALYCKDV